MAQSDELFSQRFSSRPMPRHRSLALFLILFVFFSRPPRPTSSKPSLSLALHSLPHQQQVYKARRKYTGTLVAIKRIAKAGKSPRDLAGLRSEVDILRRLRHPGIVAMLDAFETRADFCVVTEFAHGELFELLEDDGGVGGGAEEEERGGEAKASSSSSSLNKNSAAELELSRVARQLVSALHYLHSHRVIHRDMKPQNVLLGGKGQVKLCDFGFARAMGAGTAVLTSIKGTPLYMAPELVQERPYDHRADLWSLGAVLYELYTGKPPFYTSSIYTLVRKIVGEPVPPLPARASPELRSFLAGLLTKDPSKRLGWPELLDHPFVRETEAERMRREREAAEEAEAEASRRGWRGERGGEEQEEEEEREVRKFREPSIPPPTRDLIDLDRPLLAAAKPSLLVNNKNNNGGGPAALLPPPSGAVAAAGQQQQHYQMRPPPRAPAAASPLAAAAAKNAKARAAAVETAAATPPPRAAEASTPLTTTTATTTTASTSTAAAAAAAPPAPQTAEERAAPSSLLARSLSSRLEAAAADAATIEGAAAAWSFGEVEAAAAGSGSNDGCLALVLCGLSAWKRGDGEPASSSSSASSSFAAALRAAACLVALAPPDAVFDGRAAKLAAAAAAAAKCVFKDQETSPSPSLVSAAAAADALRAAEGAAAAAAAAVGKRFVCLPGSTESYALLLLPSSSSAGPPSSEASSAAAASRGLADACRRAQAALAADASPSERAAASATLAPLTKPPKSTAGGGGVSEKLVAAAAPGLALAPGGDSSHGGAEAPPPSSSSSAAALEALRALAAATFLPHTAAPDEPPMPAVLAALSVEGEGEGKEHGEEERHEQRRRRQRPSSAGPVARDLSPLVDAQSAIAARVGNALLCARKDGAAEATEGETEDRYALVKGLVAAAAGSAPGGRAAARLLVCVARSCPPSSSSSGYDENGGGGENSTSSSFPLALAASCSGLALLRAAERDAARRAPALLLALSETADAVCRELRKRGAAAAAARRRREARGPSAAAGGVLGAAVEALAPASCRSSLARRAAALLASPSADAATKAAAAAAAASLAALACRAASDADRYLSPLVEESEDEDNDEAEPASSKSSTPDWPPALVEAAFPPEVLRAVAKLLRPDENEEERGGDATPPRPPPPPPLSARVLAPVDGFPGRAGAADGAAAVVAEALAPLSLVASSSSTATAAHSQKQHREAAIEAGEALVWALGGGGRDSSCRRGESPLPPQPELSPAGCRAAAAALRRLGRPAVLGAAGILPAVPTLVSWLGKGHLDALSSRPAGLFAAGGGGGGKAAVAAAVSDAAAALHAPFAPAANSDDAPSSSSLPTLTALLVSRGAPAALAAAIPRAPACARAEAAGLAARLVLSSSTAGRGFVAAGGTSREAVSAALDPACPPSALVAGLLALSLLARASPDAAAALATGGGGGGGGGEGGVRGTEVSSRSDSTPHHLVRLLSHRDPGVRGRAASLAGNLARHSGDHYAEMGEAGLIRALISTLREEEEEDENRGEQGPSPPSSSAAAALNSVKKFAAFALGNAAFHSAALYPDLEPGIGPLVALLRQGRRRRTRRKRETGGRKRADDDGNDTAAAATTAFVNDGKAAANAAGALGNLVRNSPLLARALAAVGAPQALIEAVEEEAREEDDESSPPPSSSSFEPRDGGSPLAVALFSLGTMVAHRPLFDPAAAGSLRCRCEASTRLEAALDALDRRVAKWRREREIDGASSDSPESPPTTTVVEKYAARVRAKLEAASRA